MELTKAVCPSCGGTLNIESKSNIVFCNYCGNKFVLPQKQTNNPNIENFMKLADNAVGTSTNTDAINYYNRVLEIEPNNYEATIGKGYAICFNSSLNSPNLFEMKLLFERGYADAPSGMKDEVSKEIKQKTLIGCQSFFNMAYSHYREWKGKFTDMGALSDLYNQMTRWSMMVIMVIDDILKMGGKVNSESKALAEYGIYVVQHNENFKSSYVATKTQEYGNIIKNIDPNYTPPQASGTCFIATATMGDYNHPYVISLRKFRDEYLLKSSFGEKFVHYYYRTSPPFAKIISKSLLLRKISLHIIVKPLYSIVEKYINK